MEDLISKFGGRKFIFAALVVALGFLLAVFGKITFDQFVSLITWALAIFSISNATQKIGGEVKVYHNTEKK